VSDELTIPRHDEAASKSDRGCVLVIGGSRETPGAVLLAGLAALRVGAGKLQLATVASVAIPLAIAVPEARVIGLPETVGGDLSSDGAAKVGELVKRVDAVLLGPGVLDDAGMDALLDAILGNADGIVVVDAGAIPALGRRTSVRSRVVAIPNANEMDALGDAPAERLGITVACRDAKTTVTAPDGRTWIDDAGSLALATSGSGDVAAGAIAGLAARGATPEAAAVWGARLHGMAGERLGLGALARDVVDVLPSVLPH
jgi:hydroxyethylthiazole kinase-like uncharacterized protein yjeF